MASTALDTGPPGQCFEREMIRGRNVLVAVDHENSRTLRVAAELASLDRGRLMVLACRRDPSPLAAVGPGAETILPQVERDAETLSQRVLAAIPDSVPATARLWRGRAMDGLVAELDKRDYDIVVISGAEHRRWFRWRRNRKVLRRDWPATLVVVPGR